MEVVDGVVDGSGSSITAVHCLPAKEDNYNGMIVEIFKFPSKDVSIFVDSLRLSLQRWSRQVIFNTFLSGYGRGHQHLFCVFLNVCAHLLPLGQVVIAKSLIWKVLVHWV